MTKDVLIKISGLQTDSLYEGETENEPVEIITSASYFEKDGKHYLFYEELDQDSENVIKNRITISEKSVQVQKSGYVTTSLTFEENSRTHSVYETPFGRMTLGITSGPMSLNISEDCILAGLSYELDINNNALLDCRLILTIVPKSKGRMLLNQ